MRDFEVEQVTRRAGAILVVGLAACGQWQRVGTADRPPSPNAVLPRLFDAASVYRGMGFLVAGAPLPWVGSLRYVEGPTPDSTVAVFSISLANHALNFHRDANAFVAEYHVEMAFRGTGGAARQAARDETVRVPNFQETMRADESVIFQQLLTVTPGIYTFTVMVRDRNGPAFTRQEIQDTVPRFAGRGIASPLPFYQGTGRTSRAELPKLVLNPRATLPYGADSLRIYLEGYDLRPGVRLQVRAEDAAGTELLRDSVALAGDSALASSVVLIPPERLPIGEGEVQVWAEGVDTVRAPFLVSFSGDWVIANFDQMISLLRYFSQQAWIDKLRAATPEQRPTLWRQFWTATDPVPLTPENEALDEYFQRVQVANQRFLEEGDPGWLTDRGEVYITLGEPDEILDLSGDMSRVGPHGYQWTYTTLRLTVFFEDATGLGKYRLTPLSRSDYQRVLDRVRRGQ